MSYFIAVDVETANSDRSSICQIGLVCFHNEGIEWQWSSLVNPECEFDPVNIGVHGVTSQQVETAPKWPAVFDCIADSLREQMVVSHSSFDQFALAEASERYGLKLPTSKWIDSHALARKTWPQLKRYGLDELCHGLGIELDHHDALSDAMACGLITRLCLFADRKDLIDAQERALKASTAKPRRLARVRVPGHQEDVTASGVEGKPLAGQVVVLTGEFEGGKGVLATLAASAGCDVEANFTKSRTTILVLGHRNHDVWGYAKSGKHLRAEEAIAEGRNVQIMTEEEFRLLINNSISSGALKAAI